MDVCRGGTERREFVMSIASGDVMSEATPRDLIWKHIRAIRTCMMVTHDGAQVRARPMRGIPREDENAIWFISDTETHKDPELRDNPRACLTFCDVRGNT